MVFDFGPVNKVEIKLTGEAETIIGSYYSLPIIVQEVLQLVCHAVIQLEETVKSTDAGVFMVDKDIMLVGIDTRFNLSNWEDCMAIMNIKRTGKNSCSTDFFSVKELALTFQRIVDCAYQDMKTHGRRE